MVYLTLLTAVAWAAGPSLHKGERMQCQTGVTSRRPREAGHGPCLRPLGHEPDTEGETWVTAERRGRMASAEPSA